MKAEKGSVDGDFIKALGGTDYRQEEKSEHISGSDEYDNNLDRFTPK